MKGTQVSYSQSNFFTSTQMNSFSFENTKPKTCKSPISFQPTTIFSKCQNLQSLQQIKDQILSLQNTLHQQQKPKLVSQDKSFFNAIKDQLKQVSQLEELNISQIQRKISLQKPLSKEMSPKVSTSKNQNLHMLKNLLHLQHRDVQQIESTQKQLLQEKIQQLEVKRIKLLKKLKKRYKEEKQKILQFIDQQIAHEEQEYEAKIKQKISETLKNQKKQVVHKLETKQPNSMRLCRSQSGRVKDTNQMEIAKNSSGSSNSSNSISQLRKQLKSKKSSKVRQDKDSENDENKPQLVSSLKKLSPNPSIIRVSADKKKKQKVRFKNEIGRDEKNNNLTQPLQRFKTDDDDDDSLSDYDPKFNSLINRYY